MAQFNLLTVTIYSQSNGRACRGHYSIGLHNMSNNTELEALRYACTQALDLLKDGDAEPQDADRVTALLETILGVKS